MGRDLALTLLVVVRSAAAWTLWGAAGAAPAPARLARDIVSVETGRCRVDGERPRGVSPRRVLALSSAETCPAMFSCDGGTTRISRGWVDDGFCDCMDGSDELGSAACSARAAAKAFSCVDGGLMKRLPTSRVDDGVCDCCDGSDEPRDACPSTCGAELAQWEARLAAKLATAEAGLAARHAQDRGIDSAKAALDQELRKMSAQVQHFSDIGARMQAAPRSPEGAMRLRQLSAAHHSALSQLKTLNDVALNHISHDEGLFTMMVDDCLESELIGEKVLKGGSTNYVAKAYTFVLCPFRHVLQLHANTSSWALADCRDKHTTGHVSFVLPLHFTRIMLTI